MNAKWRAQVWRALGYVPSREQLAAHDCPARARLVAGGERGGKSYSAAMELVRECLNESALYWIVGPTYQLARPEFSYVAEALARADMIEPGSLSQPQSGPCALRVRVYGARIETRSSDDPEKLAGVAPDGILMCEAAQQSYETFLRLRGRLAERRGWLWASGTFEGSYGWYADYWQRWQPDRDGVYSNPDGGASFSLPAWSNLAIYPLGREDPEIQALARTYPADRFMERFGAVPCPPADLVFREFSHAEHVAATPFDAVHDVQLAIDPGWANAYAVLAVQVVGEQVRIIDEVYERGKTHAEVIGICKRRPWWESVTGGVIDVAAQQHPADRSALEVWREVAGWVPRCQAVKIEAGIDRTKTFLVDPGTRRPRLVIDPRCVSTIKEFGLYRYKTDRESVPVSDLPIDQHNHALKALAYFLVDLFGAVDRKPRRVLLPQRAPLFEAYR